MNKYLLEVYSENTLLFFMEFRSIRSVAKTIDRFFNTDELNIWFDLTDIIKDRSLDVNELMRVWHA